MTQNKIKRIRDPNYTELEKRTLLDLIWEEKEVIENKRTDKVWANQKKEKFKEIAEKFNASGVAVAWRSAEKLHAQYEQIKCDARKEKARYMVSKKKR
jgi:hypothetical protein